MRTMTRKFLHNKPNLLTYRQHGEKGNENDKSRN
uniref:Uncharacterized protein n=1 Tax=Myoviridae sp. ct4tH12 TaxID=2825031 RepID=A0A8S5PZ43_9CAUD|nr:MAG TPA: hypothetical protein [Myoviridae sp. ct4tH12]